MLGSNLTGIVVFVAGTLLCGGWGYLWIAAMWPAAITQPGGGIGAMSSPLLLEAVLLLTVVVCLGLTFRLTALVGSGRLATFCRAAHVVATIILVGMTVLGGQFLQAMGFAVFIPAQCFFANGSFALWISRRRPKPAVQSRIL